MLDAGLVLVVEGGQWFWPPVRIGYVRQLPGTPYMLLACIKFQGRSPCDTFLDKLRHVDWLLHDISFRRNHTPC